MSEAPKLLPCPFCGKTPEILEMPDRDKSPDYTIRCCNIDDFCYAEPDREKVIAAWNTRAPITTQAALAVPEVAALVEAAEGLVTRFMPTRGDHIFSKRAALDRLSAALRAIGEVQ